MEVVDLDEIVNSKAGELVKGKEEQIKSIMSTTLQQIQKNNIRDKQQIYRLLRKNLQPIQKIVNIDNFINITINKMWKEEKSTTSLQQLVDEAVSEYRDKLHHSYSQPREGGRFVPKKEGHKDYVVIDEQEDEDEEETFTTNKNTMDITTILERMKVIWLWIVIATAFWFAIYLYATTRTGTNAQDNIMTIREKGLEYIEFCEMQGLDRKTAFQVLNKTYNEFENNLLTGNVE